MSFSKEVKEELSKRIGNGRHCQIAEFAAIIYMLGVVKCQNDVMILVVSTESEIVANKMLYLLDKLFAEKTKLQNIDTKKHTTYKIVIEDIEVIEKIFLMTKILIDKNILEKDKEIYLQSVKIDNIVIQKPCCKRTFLRGVFLAAGSIATPEKSYHLEIVCVSDRAANHIKEIFLKFDIDAKIVMRKKYYVVYIKEGAMIIDALNIMEAHNSLMNMENVRIVKSVRNIVNRRVNCETANLNKTVNAAVRQIEEINYINKTMGIDKLPTQLRQVALIRLEEPDASLKELGLLLTPSVSKSGVNHRLRKISEIAEQLKEKNLH